MFSQIIIREIMHSTPSKCILSSTPYYNSFNRCKTNVAAHLIPEQILKPTKKSSSAAALRIKTINKAMKAYLERSKHYEDFLKVKNDEFEIGKQHLANIMGLDAATLTQEDVDKAVEYLLPSGLYEKKARPLMKPPKELFPKEKAAQFDNSGRPFSSFFYTRKSNYHASLHVLVGKFRELDEFEDRMIAKGILAPPEESIFKLGGGDWITHEELNNRFLENLHENDYEFLKTTLTRLSEHPYSFRCKDDIMKYRKEFVDLGSLETIPELMHDADGRPYMEAEGKRKNCVAKVIVRGNGTGKIKINGFDIFYFPRWNDREQIMFPLVFTELLGLVDIEADVSGVGETAQSGAIRHGLALALRSFVDPNLVEKMRLAGLLTHDYRNRGRKIYGQKGHRAKFTWKKR
ncbi:28S ribosomal protein S9, mitochondrial-like [Argiope bruennichi]|uniref:Small ribosomal subunit protein uS9m n=1 Tax=Argiope bruennichi TaxID=94029 RepID=A0A8T0F9T3_ARGBR|nr:28S ribosomal protein S9, mitochondrial-like [Argiope bruennichi]KAF8786209.1 28S ribosomal protein S9 like protein [Argiope bruennichi]